MSGIASDADEGVIENMRENPTPDTTRQTANQDSVEQPTEVRALCPTLDCKYEGITKLSEDLPEKFYSQVVQKAGRILSRQLIKEHDEGKHE